MSKLEPAGVGERSMPTAIGRSCEITGAGLTNIVWLIAIGCLAGVIARLLAPGPNKPTGFVLTQCWASPAHSSRPGSAKHWGGTGLIQGAGLIAATIRAVAVLFLRNRLVANRVIGDPGARY